MIRGIAVLMVALAAADQPAPPPPPGVTRHSLEGAVRIDTVLPGRLISYALPAMGGGRRVSARQTGKISCKRAICGAFSPHPLSRSI